MIVRWQEKELESTLNCFRIMNLTGARQSGKTTLAEMLSRPHLKRFTLDDDEVRKSASSDPLGFVERNSGETIIIDEIQKVPELLNAIKRKVDQSNDKGQYLLTGSSNLHFVKAVSDSLAGRIARVRLRPLTLGEVNGGRGAFLDKSFRHDFLNDISTLSKRNIIAYAVAGGYPEVIGMDTRMRRRWFQTYLDDLLVKDIRDVTEIRKFAFNIA